MTAFKKRVVCAIFFVSLSLSASATSQSMFHTLGWVKPTVPLSEVLRYPVVTDKIYSALRHKLIWLQSQDQTLLEEQIEMLVLADISPFFNDKLYQLRELRQSERYFEYDIVATDTLLAYLSYRSLLQENKHTWLYGTGLPDKWSQPSEESINALIEAITKQKLSSYLTTLGPDLETYQAYQGAIDGLQQAMSRSIPDYSTETLLRIGDQLPDQEVLFERLKLAGLNLDGVDQQQQWYGKELEEVVKAFQRQHGLKEDGVIGPNTLQWLNYPIEERIRRLALNAERSRLWPTQRDALVMVNLPGFELNYYYQGKVEFTSKVIVGKVSRKTPMLSIKMDSLVLNPTWNVPSKIMREDILPIARYNPDYLFKRGIQVINGWTNPQVIDPTTIEWNKVNAKTFPYRMRQLSGQMNALGIYKFNTPNRRAIYLHDTPSKYLFDRPSRAFSSGCIRVQHADQFANTLSETQGFRENDISPVNKSANTQIPLKRRLPVHLIYQTSWVDNGEVHFREDIYGYDTSAKSSSYVKTEN